jgi:trans-aconitate 2-methyltransferase
MATHQWDVQTYDRIADPQTRWGAAVLDRLELAGDERVLDAACGTGRVSEQLLERIPRGRLVALDGDAAMIAEARVRLAPFGYRVQFVVANLLDPLPLSEQVDAIFSTAAFHWIRDHDRLFANLAAVLRPGGQLVAQCGGAGNVASFMAAVDELGESLDGPWNFATPEDTRRRLVSAGFVDVNVWLNDEPTPFATAEDMDLFIRTSCLGPWLSRLPAERYERLAQGVAARLPKPELDYVRLNIVARRSAHN